jgi:hypothetical protein
MAERLEATRLPFPENDNEIIAKFLGYKYKYDAYEDFSDIGGVYSDITYYSKEPLYFDFIHEDGREEELFKWPKDLIVIETGSYSEHGYLSELIYHKSWDQLMKAAVKLGMDKINTDIEIAYKEILTKIKAK